MKYDPITKQVTVLLRDLGLANGVAVNKGGSFVLVGEFIAARIQRYWLKGPKAMTLELFLYPPGKGGMQEESFGWLLKQEQLCLWG